MKLENINKEQQLYVLKCCSILSSYGFDLLHTKATAVADWMDVEAPVAALGTEEHFEQCAELMRRGQVYANASRKCCPGNLSPQLIGLEGCRVRVTTDDGEERCFWVAKTTGWMPGHLEVPRSNTAYGHPAQAHYKSVQTIR